jgi:hypothetical protein
MAVLHPGYMYAVKSGNYANPFDHRFLRRSKGLARGILVLVLSDARLARVTVSR